MKRIAIAAAALGFLAGCAGTIVGVGETSAGQSITGQIDGSFADGKAVLTVSAITVNHGVCKGSATRANGYTQPIISIPLTCDNGRTGTATLTSDYINYRDTVVYQVGRERGRLTFGLSSQVAS